ncbi:hypothetical protein H2204_013536 [Knufia peltigerae]|uniref:Uncharacterized protein n=1 Tax=Knufia peltigerae TaxID=1002370 RepID=A0AA38XQD5_9EURO|nr:hypothetical protein H2204_013536 [Knufia peltigerae]
MTRWRSTCSPFRNLLLPWTVSEFDLRKRRGTETEESSHPRAAYQVIPERQTKVEGFFGGDRAYDLKSSQANLPVLGQEETRKRKKPGDVDVSMNPDALAAHDGMDQEDLRRAYDQQRKSEQNPEWDFREDFPRRSPPPRDRPHRERDDHPNVEYFGEGESYRPGGPTGEGPYRPSVRDRIGADSWSADRRDGRRDERRDERREDIDSYVPNTSSRVARPRSRSPPPFRRRSRSRSPPNRGREDLFPNRRSPPPRRYSPRRSPPPRRRSRSAYGARPRTPPDTKRYRDYSPDSSRRSPKRERRLSPERNRFDRRSPPRRGFSPDRDSGRGGESYRPRSRSPPRRRPGDDNWRRRSPSPRTSGPASNNTSRRSSPPAAQPDRASVAGSVPRSPAYPAARSQYDRQEPSGYSERAVEPPRTRDASTTRDDGRSNGEAPQPPSGPSSHRNGEYNRPPPTGPSRSFSQTQQSPPTGPAASLRGAPRAAPTGPRGTVGRFEPPPRDFTSPPARGRGSSLTYRGGPPPFGPRGSSYGRGDFGGGSGGVSSDGGAGRGDFGGASSSYRGGFGRGEALPFRGNSSTSATYPRTQRFNTVQQHLATNEKIVPGGKLLPSGLPPDQEKRIKMLEAEAERMRSEIVEKQKSKREVLDEWEIRERESERESLRSELADAHLQQLMEGEDALGRAAF